MLIISVNPFFFADWCRDLENQAIDSTKVGLTVGILILTFRFLKLLRHLSARAIIGMALMVILPGALEASGSNASEVSRSVAQALPAKTRVDDIFSILGRKGAPQREGTADCAFAFESSGSTWSAGLDEKKVFLAALKAGGVRLGIGKGGQIYSLRGPFGESVPPQRSNAPWIDEVWHLVVTNNDLVTPVHEFQNSDPQRNWAAGMPIQYFIHQAGIYLKGLTGTQETGASAEPFYSPLLRCKWDEKTRTLYLANWAQQARSPNVWKSGVLVQTSYRDLGDGAIEITQSLSNFGDQTLTYLNAPWGGVRLSSLPQTVLSEPGGAWKKVKGKWGWEGIPSVPFKATGGWIAWTVDAENPESPSLALVFGREVEGVPPWKMGANIIRYGTAGNTESRNYEVVETSCNVCIASGESLLVRWYLVAGAFAQARERAAEFVSHAGMWKPIPDADLIQPVWISDGVPSAVGKGEPALYLYAQPVSGAVPVFAMEDTRSGKVFATLDPYELTPTAPYPNPLPSSHPQHALYQNRVVHYQYDSPGNLKELLGYARLMKSPDSGETLFQLPRIEADAVSIWVPRPFQKSQ